MKSTKAMKQQIFREAIGNLAVVVNSMTFDTFAARLYPGFAEDTYLSQRWYLFQRDFMTWWAEADKSRRDALIVMMTKDTPDGE